MSIEHALAAWQALRDRCIVRRRLGGTIVLDGPGRSSSPVALWPLSQVLAASVDLAHLTGEWDDVDVIVGVLGRYRVGEAFAALPGDRIRYFDDNAWVALALLQAGWIEHARALFPFLAAGTDRRGGVLWVEGSSSRNTCSTGPAAQVAARLHLLTGDERYLDYADRQLRWLDSTLRSPDHLYWDHVDGQGRIEQTIWSYNQGTPLGAHVLLHRITGDRAYLDRARYTADAALDRFAEEDRWWVHPPAFNAIFFRNLLTLQDLAGTPRDLDVLDRYLERAWEEGRDPRTGFFTAGGIGSYDGRPTIDQAALVQLFALRAWPPARWVDIT